MVTGQVSPQVLARRAGSAGARELAVEGVLGVLRSIRDALAVAPFSSETSLRSVPSDDQAATDVVVVLGRLRAHFTGDSPLHPELDQGGAR